MAEQQEPNAAETQATKNEASEESSSSAAPASADSTTIAKPMPLHSKWTLWFDNSRMAPDGSDWKDCLVQCGSFDTIDSFWRIFNSLKPASKVHVNSNYSIFRYGIEPSWEDPENVNGGKFVLTLNKKDSKNGKCDEWWLYTVLACIGETMDINGNQVCGAVVSLRKSQDRVALWLKSNEKDICVKIGERWKKALNLHKVALRFQMHKDAAASGRSFRNESYFEVW